MHLYDALQQLKKQGYLRVFDDTLDLSIDDALKMAQEADSKQYWLWECKIYTEPKKPVNNVPVFIATRSGSLSDCVKAISKLGADTIITNAGRVDICDYLAETITEERDTDGFSDRRFRVDVDAQQIIDTDTGAVYVEYSGERLQARKQRIAAASVKTEKKAAASAANGKKGGRPKTDRYYVISGTSLASASKPSYYVFWLTEKEIITRADEHEMHRGYSLEDHAGIEMIENEDGDFTPARDWKPGEKLETAVDVLRRDSCTWDIYPDTVRGIREFRRAAKQISETLYLKALDLSK